MYFNEKNFKKVFIISHTIKEEVIFMCVYIFLLDFFIKFILLELIY